LCRLRTLQEQTKHSASCQSRHADHKPLISLFEIGWFSTDQPILPEAYVWFSFFLERLCIKSNAVPPFALPAVLIRGILKHYRLSSLGLPGGAALRDPYFSSESILSGSFILPISIQPIPAYLDNPERRSVGFLIEHFQYHNRFGIDVINDSP
jgi:hypothetical protein